MTRRRRALVIPILAGGLVLVLALTAGVAEANWSATSTPAGNGASGAATLEPGARPTAVAASSTVTLTSPASTVSSGESVAGYRVTRYDTTTMTAQTVTAGCAGLVTSPGCTESGLPDGIWVYTITPAIGANWTGAASPLSAPVTTDSTPPTNDISTTVLAGNAAQVGGTVFYRGVAPGSLTLTNAVTDAGSGPASSTTTALAGDASGWTHTASTVTSPTGGPYTANPFSWSAATTSAPTTVVTGRDAADNAANTTLTFVDDSAPPSAAAISYLDGYQPDQSVTVTATAGTDGGSGIATRQLQRAEAVLTDGVCGSFTGFAAVGPDSPTSPYRDTEVANGSCYTYRYVITDRVGNQAIAASASVAKVDPFAGGPPLGDASSYSILAGTGVVNTLATTISGDLGVSPGNAITGFPPGIVAGTTHAGDPAAAAAQSDLVLAYNDAAARTPDAQFTGDQNGQTFTPGVFHTTAAFSR